MNNEKSIQPLLDMLFSNMERLIVRARRQKDLSLSLKAHDMFFKHIIDLRKLNPLDLSLMTEEESTYIMENIIAMQDGVPYVPGTHLLTEEAPEAKH